MRNPSKAIASSSRATLAIASTSAAVSDPPSTRDSYDTGSNQNPAVAAGRWPIGSSTHAVAVASREAMTANFIGTGTHP